MGFWDDSILHNSQKLLTDVDVSEIILFLVFPPEVPTVVRTSGMIIFLTVPLDRPTGVGLL